jgi:crotonobetainyl-CoA:carnitine CoA-transferase CaiB-like acyl-CoA transferase
MWGPVNRLEDVPGDPHVMARGLVERMTRADGGAQWIVRQPLRFSRYVNADLRPAPGLGAHQGQGFMPSGGQGGAR